MEIFEEFFPNNWKSKIPFFFEILIHVLGIYAMPEVICCFAASMYFFMTIIVLQCQMIKQFNTE